MWPSCLAYHSQTWEISFIHTKPGLNTALEREPPSPSTERIPPKSCSLLVLRPSARDWWMSVSVSPPGPHVLLPAHLKLRRGRGLPPPVRRASEVVQLPPNQDDNVPACPQAVISWPGQDGIHLVGPTSGHQPVSSHFRESWQQTGELICDCGSFSLCLRSPHGCQ